MLLVPGGRRQDNIGVDAGGGHPEVDVDEQVELALGRLVPPGHLGGSSAGRAFLGADRVIRTEQVAQEVLVALSRGTEQVGAPHRQHPGEVGRVVGVGRREAAAAPPCSSSTT